MKTTTKRRPRSRSVLPLLLKGSVRYFVLCMLAGLLFTCCQLVIPQILRITVDSVIGDEPLTLPAVLQKPFAVIGGLDGLKSGMWRSALLLLVFGTLSAVFRYLMNLSSAKAGETLVETSHNLLYHHIQHLPWSWLNKNPTGDLIQRCTSDVERIKTFFQEQFVSVFRIVALIALSLACMIAMNWRLSLIAIILCPIIVCYSLLFHNHIRDRFTDCDESEGVLSTIAQENLTGIRVVRAFGRENFERERFDKQNESYTGLWVRLCRTLASFWAVGDCTSCLQVMLVVIFGSVLCVNGEMTAGEFISFAFYNSMLVDPVRRLGRMISEMSKAGVSLSRISEILNAEPEADAPDAAEAPMDGDIAFEHVSFQYEESAAVLQDVSFTVRAGSSFGILGGTGSGKSSLLLLLTRLYAPTSGRITVGGCDIAAMPAAWVRRHIGIVLQEPFLFSRTLRENIGICGADAEEIVKAAKTACIDEDISRFTAGYETLVGERGVTLSGGQKQRVAIARTLTQKTPVIVFDDSLSAVDTETDEKIRAALKRDLKSATSIIISHRVTTLMHCDCVLVLDHGVVSELGTPESLLQQNGLFRKVYDMQMSIGEEADA